MNEESWPSHTIASLLFCWYLKMTQKHCGVGVVVACVTLDWPSLLFGLSVSSTQLCTFVKTNLLKKKVKNPS